MALTNRAFERTPTARLGNRPVTEDECWPTTHWLNSDRASLRSLSAANARNPMNTLRAPSSLRLCAFARVILSLLLLSSSTLAARVERLIDTWKPQHYLVNITLNDQLSEITSASARINVRS